MFSIFKSIPEARNFQYLIITLLCLSACLVETVTAETPDNSSRLNHAVYIEMPDGINIAADIWLPEKSDKRFPLIVELTRYWRTFDSLPPRDRVELFTERGFAYAAVDTRGSGASFGVRNAEFSVEETMDFQHILTWLTNQPWSDGTAATIGISYPGNTAENAMIDAPAALKATIPRFTDFDLYTSLFFPGGLPNIGFVKPWGAGVRALDINNTKNIDAIHPVWEDLKDISVKPVDRDTNRQLLAEASQAHQSNISVNHLIESIIYRDDYPLTGDIALDSPTGYSISPHLAQKDERLQQIPSYHWASFFDAGTASGALSRFMMSDAPMQVVIGYWTHGARHDANPYRPHDADVQPSISTQYDNMVAFLNHHMSRNHTSANQERAIYYLTAGDKNVWKKTEVWPPKGTEMQRWYLSSEGALDQTPPGKANAHDQYTVNYNVGTGDRTRWSTQMGGSDVVYSDRQEADQLLLTYTSPPLTEDIEITGHPVIKLAMTSTETDGAVIAYLEEVAPDGSVTMLSEGHLRLIHRKISTEEPPYPVFGPYHTFKKKDAAPMEPDNITNVEFVLLPVSVSIKKGHSIRVAIAGHDKDNFQRIPKTGTPTYKIYRQKNVNSYIEIPIAKPEFQTLAAPWD